MKNLLNLIRKGTTNMIIIGNHSAIVQSILDFDFLCGKSSPSLAGIVSSGRKAIKMFFGTREILVPCYPDVETASKAMRSKIQWMLNVQSGRRAYESTNAFFEFFPSALGGSIFAENVPERHATELIKRFSGKKLIFGPASVGFLVPGYLKLGAIGGIDPMQIQAGKLMTPGSIAVGSTSGGMTNELIRMVISAGQRVSFASAVGGDRFPVVSLTDFFVLAENDPQTHGVVYFGELGGTDEYEIIDLMKAKKFTKPLIAYVAGVIDEAFDDHMQFGHAKALVFHREESARAKRTALREAGAIVPDRFADMSQQVKALPHDPFHDTVADIEPLMNRQKSILSTREIIDSDHIPTRQGFSKAILEAWLGKSIKSKITEEFADSVFQRLIDHGGHVSGAVNTMITARAGKDLVSSLASGLLTIGPRFGGAINEAAICWLDAVASQQSPDDFVARINASGKFIAGIGHKKYRVGVPDPRVKAISKFTARLKRHPHYDFARNVEKITTGKNGNLILNIDGALAAIALDILAECETYSAAQLRELADAEFFNAFFVLSRAAGFIAHFMEQKRNDEGLFRLPDNLLFVRKNAKK